MTDVLQYQVEQSGDAATLYLSGVVRHTDHVATLVELCNALPAGVRTLRLDLGAARQVGADDMEAARVAPPGHEPGSQGPWTCFHVLFALPRGGCAPGAICYRPAC